MYICLRDGTNVYDVPDSISTPSGNNYELGERIGGGGNGAVYECIDRSGNTLAIKFLLRFSQKSEARFKQETTILKKVNSPHIIKYIDDGCITGHTVRYNKVTDTVKEILFVVMEKADCNLAEYLKREETLVPYEVYAGQFRGLCEALAELHQYAIHRDIKPENILVKGEKWILSDFGLCQAVLPEERIDVTDYNEKIGPAFWMSPEAIDRYYFGGSDIAACSDVYQLCAIFAFVLTKHYPGGIIVDQSALNTTPELSALILNSLSNSTALRPKDGGELLNCYNEATYAI